MTACAKTLLDEVFHDSLMPPPHDLTIDQWADENRILSSKSSAEPGRFRSIRTPYAIEPMRELSVGSSTQKVVLMWASQTAKTELGNNFIGYIIDYAPASILMVQPSIGLARRQSKTRVEPMIRDCPALAKKIPPARKRDSDNTALEKSFPGGILIFAGAEAASGLASMPIKYLLLDEVDRFPADVEKEGDPVDLAIVRTRSFGKNKKILITSTPTIEGHSRIEIEYDLSDQRQYHVPCPHCKEKQTLKFGGKDETSGLTWEDGKPETAVYVCEHCGCTIEEHFKTWMLENGEWIAKYPERDVRGYHLNALYSPIGFYSWEDMVREWLEAKKSQEKLKAFVNTALAEVWVEKGESPDWEKLYKRRESYKTQTVPKEALILTAGADVQKDRIELLVQGWGRRGHRWAIDYITLQGSPDDRGVWDQLDKILEEKEYPHELGASLKIRKLAIDTGGHSTQSVYSWLRFQDQDRVIGIKGNDAMPMVIGRPTQVDLVMDGVTVYRATQIWNIGVSHIKSKLFADLKKEEPLEKDSPLPYGWCHYPEWDKTFFKGLCSEKKVFDGGKSKWVQVYERNEPLDNSVYAYAAAVSIGVETWNDDDWDALERQIKAEAIHTRRKPSNYLDEGGYIQQDRESYIT